MNVAKADGRLGWGDADSGDVAGLGGGNGLNNRAFETADVADNVIGRERAHDDIGFPPHQNGGGEADCCG